MDDYNYKIQRELERGERIIVGVNRFVPKNADPPKRFQFEPARMQAHIRRFKERQATRDRAALAPRMAELYRVAKRRENSHQAMIDALIVGASIGEVWGTVRVANGLPFDPFRAIESPFIYPTP
jgi:methylmalonyl-CoA mutase, N-terminal domain